VIQTYLAQIKTAVDQYAAANFVVESTLNFESRPGNQAYLHGVIVFVDGSRFFFREYLDETDEEIAKLMYTYHYQGAGGHLLFRYDNAKHKPALAFDEHKQLSETQIIPADAPTLTAVLAEIAERQGWI
jgi:hypothetical protein